MTSDANINNLKRSIMRLVHLLLFLNLVVEAVSQEHPPVINYPPSIYGADNQNWMLTQGPDKTIYAANNRGLLSYNGAQWQLYPSPNETLMRAVKAVDAYIYTGAYMDFGFWEKDVTGILRYTSITSAASIKMVEDEHIWNIVHYQGFVLFQSLDRIYMYDSDTREVKVIAPEDKIIRLYLVGEDLLFQVRGKGLFAIQNGEAVLYNNDVIFRESNLINVFRIDGRFVGITASKGFFEFDNKTAVSWDKINDAILQQINVYSALQRENGAIVLGTIENGIVQFSKEGVVDYLIKKGSGLNNNTALALLEDHSKNLWIGLDAGIDFVNKEGPFSQYIDVSGVLGTVYAAAFHNGYMYLGTNQGLFFKQQGTKGGFTRMPNIDGQVWDLTISNDSLFCGHNKGTYLIKGASSERIVTVDGTWGIKEIPGQPHLLLQGNYDGLYVIEKTPSGWKLRNKISDFINSSKHFELVDAQTVLVSHEYKGVFHIELDATLRRAVTVKKLETPDAGEHSSLSRLGKTIIYANKDGFYTYNKDKGAFYFEESLASIYNEERFVTGKLVQDNAQLWTFTKDNLTQITTNKLDGSFATRSIPFPVDYRNTVAGYEIFERFRESEYLLGTSNGYFIVDTSQFSEQNHEVAINTVKVGKLGETFNFAALEQEGDFAAAYNNVRFSYHVPAYDKFSKTQYSYQLEGLYDQWSPWATSASVSFDNLPYGDYVFKVKGRNGKQVTINEERYAFTVARPWYASGLALLIYVLFAIGLFVALNWFYKKYYNKQQQLALERTKKDMELKALESEKQIIELNNANLKQDIESRNRELAVSTMNMVNKNKTLTSIKSELLKAKSIDDIEGIIEVVDNTIENEENWNFFEKAFNHADKDFFTKVKAQHPTLTANDLKLCVYLRLNMSSKEIAPLLNISPRSVEIKRYRLRKKLDLTRETNLNDYFINL